MGLSSWDWNLVQQSKGHTPDQETLSRKGRNLGIRERGDQSQGWIPPQTIPIHASSAHLADISDCVNHFSALGISVFFLAIFSPDTRQFTPSVSITNKIKQYRTQAYSSCYYISLTGLRSFLIFFWSLNTDIFGHSQAFCLQKYFSTIPPAGIPD